MQVQYTYPPTHPTNAKTETICDIKNLQGLNDSPFTVSIKWDFRGQNSSHIFGAKAVVEKWISTVIWNVCRIFPSAVFQENLFQ